MKGISLVAKTSHRVNSQLSPEAPVYSELLHYSGWEVTLYMGLPNVGRIKSQATDVQSESISVF